MSAKKQYTGEVVGDKMKKTRIVRIKLLSKHPKYGRIIKRHKKFKAHDEKEVSKLGDIVIIEQTRPISKEKRFRVLEVVSKSKLGTTLIEDNVK